MSLLDNYYIVLEGRGRSVWFFQIWCIGSRGSCKHIIGGARLLRKKKCTSDMAGDGPLCTNNWWWDYFNIPVSHVLAKGTPQHRTGREQSYSQNYKAIIRSMYVGRPSYQKQFWMATGLGWQGLRTWSYSATNFIPGAFRLLALLVTLHLLLVGATVGTGVVHGFQCTSFLCKALAEGAVQDVSPSTLCVAAVEQYVCCSSLWGWRTAFPYIIIWLTKPCMDKYH